MQCRMFFVLHPSYNAVCAAIYEIGQGGFCNALNSRPAARQVQARYIVERMDAELWGKVLDEENPFRRQLIDQVRAPA